MAKIPVRSVQVSKHEWFTVKFEGNNVKSITRHRLVWCDGEPSAKMPNKLKIIVELARCAEEGDSDDR